MLQLEEVVMSKKNDDTEAFLKFEREERARREELKRRDAEVNAKRAREAEEAKRRADEAARKKK
jgi:hypothetical protein